MVRAIGGDTPESTTSQPSRRAAASERRRWFAVAASTADTPVMSTIATFDPVLPMVSKSFSMA